LDATEFGPFLCQLVVDAFLNCPNSLKNLARKIDPHKPSIMPHTVELERERSRKEIMVIPEIQCGVKNNVIKINASILVHVKI
jgi:hypothetical protein